MSSQSPFILNTNMDNIILELYARTISTGCITPADWFLLTKMMFSDSLSIEQGEIIRRILYAIRRRFIKRVPPITTYHCRAV
ncbi:hypothetical protein IQ235_07045 [Oscillatoriales cyanobacterium LEGE 11467]|uniref:Uncharacterized protein n=1 Tax=Zarconia navalis LEGE 11467 TaxID=1828826 RepID=A0A928Z990_9CYAN|nr:hypothetical protein [Zarconia navalis]MBE9040541.1 hypothetical protein [Zarconia navalis LEGE 11467]